MSSIPISVQGFHKLEKELVESINRKPVPQTVLLIQKLRNTYIANRNQDRRQKMKNMLEALASAITVANITKETAKNFLLY